MDRNDILERLDRMDMEAFATIDDSNKYQVIIVGGSGLVLLGTISRVTQDIDTLDASQVIQHLLSKYDANLRVAAYINNFPYNYEDRIKRVPVGGRKIEFYTASLEDIVIAKLYSNRDVDRQDIISDSVLRNLDWKILEHLALDENETQASALNTHRYQDFLYNYKEYVRIYRPDENADL